MQKLEKWINEFEHGVIYLSLGSLIKGDSMPDEKRHAFIKAFERLPQRVLWKWENETMLGRTSNILIKKWMQQFDVLCKFQPDSFKTAYLLKSEYCVTNYECELLVN